MASRMHDTSVTEKRGKRCLSRKGNFRCDREKIKILDGACMEAEVKDNFPVMSGKVGNKNVEVLRDRCNRVTVLFTEINSG